MLSILKNRVYRHLLAAQVVALAGTGLARLHWGCLHMICWRRGRYVLGHGTDHQDGGLCNCAPLAAAIAERLDRRKMLVVLDLVRALLRYVCRLLPKSGRSMF